MTNQEFSNSMDTLLNSYGAMGSFGEDSSKQLVVLDEYEKSLFLTKSQEEIAESLYNGRNPFGESFEQTEELRRYISNLVCEIELYPDTNTDAKGVGGTKSTFFVFPSNPELWFITYESVTISNTGKCNDGAVLDVVPVTQDEYHRIKRNPFRGCTSRRALRLDLSDNIIEVVCDYTISKYYVRFIRRPKPIILEDLPGGLSINNSSNYSECELHEVLHQKILDHAVELALRSKGMIKNKE